MRAPRVGRARVVRRPTRRARRLLKAAPLLEEPDQLRVRRGPRGTARRRGLRAEWGVEDEQMDEGREEGGEDGEDAVRHVSR